MWSSNRRVIINIYEIGSLFECRVKFEPHPKREIPNAITVVWPQKVFTSVKRDASSAQKIIQSSTHTRKNARTLNTCYAKTTIQPITKVT